MKKIFTLLLILSFFASLIPANTFASSKSDSYFIVTAYYSPLPNQKHYLKGDYEAEKTLNGNGIRGASGKRVFSGMLAAPKGYNFGTKIYLEGLGIGEVSDRGGAIVHAGKRGYSYDRIDLWVGYGDEGLKRALYWGKRKIKGRIVGYKTPVTINNKKIPSPNWATRGLRKISNIFNSPLGIGSDKNQVIELQKFLKETGLYNGEINGIYNSKLIDIIYDFQVNNKLIKKGNLYGAGYWGYKTRNLMLKKYLNGDFDGKSNIIITKDIPKKTLSIFEKPLKTIDETKKLQEILKKLELYSGEINGSYSDIKNIILNFQLENEIIKTKNELGASYFGPKTRAKLKEKYNEYQKQEEIKKQEDIRKKQLEEKFKQLQNLSLKQAEKELKNIGTPRLGEVSVNVRELQKKLKLVGYFNYKDTAIFGNITKKSLIKYQLDNDLIKNENQYGAGIFGPKTKEKLKQDLTKIILNEKIKKDESLANFVNNDKKENKIVNKEQIAETEKKEIEVSKNIEKKDYLQVMLQIENRIII